MNRLCLISFAFITLMLTGCLQIPLGYTPNVDIIQNNNINKYDISFSVEYLSDSSDFFGKAEKEQYTKWIKEYLSATNAFNSITYCSLSAKSNYHIHFLIHYSYMKPTESIAIGYLMGYTLCTIPMWVNMNLDVSAILFLNGEVLYSPTTAEALRCYVWLPFLPVGLVWNQWWAWTTQEKKCCRYLINEIIEYQNNNL